MSFSSRPFLAEKSSSQSPIAPKKSSSISTQGKVHKQQTNPSPKSLSKKWEHKENHGSEKGRFGFSEKPPIAAGKPFLSPRGSRVAASAAKSPVIRPSPKKILGERNHFYPEANLLAEEALVKDDKLGIRSFISNARTITKDVAVVENQQTFHPEANLPAEEALVNEDTFGIRSSPDVHTIIKDVAAAEFHQTEETEMRFVGSKPAATLDTRETLPVGSSASLQELVESILRDMSHGSRSGLATQESHLQEHSVGILGEKDSNTDASEKFDSVSAVTEEYNVSRLSSPQYFKYVRAELKHQGDNFCPETEKGIPGDDCRTESCGSAVNAIGATTPLNNDLNESQTLDGFENEASSKHLAADDKANRSTGGECDAISAGLMEMGMEAQDGCFELKHDLPQSAARARFSHSTVYTFICFAAIILLTIGSPGFLPTLVQRNPFSRFWQENIYSEQIKLLIKGAEGLWTDSPTTYYHYPIFEGLQLQKNVKIAVTVMKKNLQSSEVLSRVTKLWRFVKEETIASLDVESFQRLLQQIGRFISSTFYKINNQFCSGDLQNSLQKMSNHWKHRLPDCLTPLHIQATIARFRYQLTERVQTYDLLMAVERFTTHLMDSTLNIMKTLQYQASLSNLKEEFDKFKGRLLGIFQAQIFQTLSVDSVSSVMESLQYDSLSSTLHSKYVSLKHFIVETANAFMEYLMRKPAQQRHIDLSSAGIEEWDWFSEYDIPNDEYLESLEPSEKSMTTSTDLPQLDELLSAILYGSSEEIKARYLELLHIMDSDEEIELSLETFEQSNQPTDDEIMSASNECHFETWEEEILSICAISHRKSMSTFNVPLMATSSSRELRQIKNDGMIRTQKMHMADEIESNVEALQENPKENSPYTSLLPEFELHQQASVINPADSEEGALLAKNSKVLSLRSSLNFNNGTVYALIIVAFSISAVSLYRHYKLSKAKRLAKPYDRIEEDDSTNLKEAEMYTPKIKEVEKFTDAATATFSTPEYSKPNNMEGTLNTSPDHFVESPFGSFTAYRRVIQKEGSGQEEVRLTPIRRSSRIRNQILSPKQSKDILSPAS